MTKIVKCNKRTLKKRIRYIIFLCILITIFIYSGIIIYNTASLLRTESGMISNYFSTYIAHNMNSPSFLQLMDIEDLSQLSPDSEEFNDWIHNIRINGNISNIELIKSAISDRLRSIPVIVMENMENHADHSLSKITGKDDFYGVENILQIKITINDKVIYADREYIDVKKPMLVVKTENKAQGPDNVIELKHLLDYLNSESICGIQDNNGKTIATVSVKLDYGTILGFIFFFIGGFILTLILAIVAGLFVSKLLTYPVLIPLSKLQEKFKVIASGDIESTINTHIVMKRPLREIESLAESTNSIMNKMKEYSDILTAQNQELEAQNEELTLSKKKIEEAQMQLVQNESMASIGQLTAAITHEINTPLSAINSNAQICDLLLKNILELEEVRSDDKLLDLISQMQEANNVSLLACDRVNQIIRSLKTFSKVDQAEFQEADINDGLHSVLVLTSNLWKRRIEMHEDYGQLPLVKCFSGMLNQVFMNIIVNAIQSIEDNGDIYIKTCTDGQNVVISIRDTGCGIKPELLDKIFENGFTTKSSMLGMGLGLSISKNIVVKKHNGEINVHSTPGKGTEFIMKIPISRPVE